MARALSNSNLVAALSDGVALLTTRYRAPLLLRFWDNGGSRRGYATAAAGTTTTTGSRERLAVAEQMVKRAPPAGAEEAAACSWVPDPATGYYRPANRMGEIDPAELREMMLSHNKSRD
nr:PREDICTED: late embryogenesis abundant protein Lea5-like [Musa acuminata subsp. malaccensis]